jgi:hypothetical protein
MKFINAPRNRRILKSDSLTVMHPRITKFDYDGLPKGSPNGRNHLVSIA